MSCNFNCGTECSSQFLIGDNFSCIGPRGPTGPTGSIENITQNGLHVISGVIENNVMVVTFNDNSTGQIGCPCELPIIGPSGLNVSTGIITGTVMIVTYTDGSTGQVGNSC